MRDVVSEGREPPASLPASLSPFIGREREIARATVLIDDPSIRLITLTGPGGVGKTRLALHLAARSGAVEVVWLSLAAIRDPALVVPAIGRELGLRGTSERPLLDRLARLLAGRRVLLLLDNFEQVIDAAPAIADLLRACPGVSALVTSRSPLRITGEHELDVRPLAVPDLARLPSEEAVLRSDAVAMFLARVAAVRPDYTPGSADLPTIVEICIRLDALPLALELAAARCRVLSPDGLLAHLSHRLQLLTSGPRDLPARLRTMRDAIYWSYALLSADQQALFLRLSVFVGGFTLETTEMLAGTLAPNCDGPTASLAVLDGITELANQSLLYRTEGSPASSRLAMLETIREFGLEELAASGEEDAVRRTHAHWCLDLADRGKAMFWGIEPGDWRELIEPEHANLRAGFAWLLDNGDSVSALRLATDLEPLWWVLAHGVEGADWLHRAFDLAPNAPAALRAEALVVMARLGERAREYGTARSLAASALAIARRHRDEAGIARAIDMQAQIAVQTGDLEVARSLLDDAVARFRRLGDRGRLGWALCNRGAFPVPGDSASIEHATACCTEALALFRQLDHQVGIGRALHGLADLAPDTSDALALYQESIPFLRYDGASSGLASSLEGIAVMAHRQGHDARAARIIGGAYAIREACAVYRAPYTLPGLEGAEASMRKTLGDRAFDAAYAAGRTMTLDDALALALQPLPPDHDRALPRLTRRQREILHYIAEGRSNREIADTLYVSVRTVEDHVSNLLERLGVTSRAEAAALARGVECASPRFHDNPAP